MNYQSCYLPNMLTTDFLSASNANSQTSGGKVCFMENAISNSCNLCMKNDHLFVYECGYYFVTYQLDIANNCNCDQNLSAYLCVNGNKVNASCTTMNNCNTLLKTLIIYLDTNSCLSLQTNGDNFTICDASINIFKL